MLKTPKDYSVAAVYFTMNALAQMPGRVVLAALLGIAVLAQF